MRDGWHTIPVKLLSQLGLSFSPPCSTNSSMGLSRYKRIRFRLHVLDSGTARTGQCKAVDPQYEQKIRGTQAWFYQSSGTTGVDDAGSTVATQWPTSMQYQVASWICTDCGALTDCSPCPTQDVTYMALMVLRETTEDLTEFTPGRCRYD